MEVWQFFRPKNFQIKSIYKGTDELIPVDNLNPGETGQVEYFFGGKVYRHIGEWPPKKIVPSFKLPILSAKLDNYTFTEQVKKIYLGPTNSKINLDVYVPRPHFKISITKGGIRFSLGIKWILKEKVSGLLKILHLFGQETIHIVE